MKVLTLHFLVVYHSNSNQIQISKTQTNNQAARHVLLTKKIDLTYFAVDPLVTRWTITTVDVSSVETFSSIPTGTTGAFVDICQSENKVKL